MFTNFDGVHVTTITPFKPKTYEVDYPGLGRNTEFLVDSGISSLVPLGTVGEFPSLTMEERKAVAEKVIDSANGRKPTIVGVSSTSHLDVIEYAKHAKDAGADAVLLVPPYYFKDRDEGLLSFFELVSGKIDIGIVLYNLPGATKFNLTSSLLQKILDRVDNVVAIKDATKDLTQLTDTIRTIGKRVPVIAGAEEIAYFGLVAGSRGATSGMANFLPEIPVSMCKAANEGSLEKARTIFTERLLRFRHLDVPGILQGYPVQNAYIKEAMNIIGMAAGPVRPPLAPLSDEKIAQLRVALEELRLLPAKASISRS